MTKENLKEGIRSLIRSKLLGNARVVSALAKHTAFRDDAKDAIDRADNIQDPTEKQKKLDIESGRVQKHDKQIGRINKVYQKSQMVESTDELDEVHKLNDPVEIIKGEGKGIRGTIGEIRHGLYKGAPKTYTVFHDVNDAIQVPKEHIRKIKKSVDLQEEIKSPDQAHQYLMLSDQAYALNCAKIAEKLEGFLSGELNPEDYQDVQQMIQANSNKRRLVFPASGQVQGQSALGGVPQSTKNSIIYKTLSAIKGK